ncbi:MAG TPA: hypothetical protein VMV86_03685, partial [Methanosarcinales archaeon]|nr:hypothetical protein [Methanosarcinales archaeon]
MASITVNPFRGVIGLPPRSHISDDEIINSMPILKITPGQPQWAEGLTVFTINTDWQLFTDLLGNSGYNIDSKPIKIAYLADNFPTDSFTNEYNETFLQGITQAASSGLSQVSQMLGARTIREGADKFIGQLASVGESQKGTTTGDMFTGAANMMKKSVTGLSNFNANLKKSGGVGTVIGGGLETVGEILAGHRVDFPKVWTNSSYEPSYTVTVRLYNPFPGNNEALKKYIIGPLAVLLTLGLPIDKSGETGPAYSWPFFHKIKSEGIFDLNPAVITNITVIKGGDQQQISHAQTMGIVDVRMDFASLFSSIFSEAGKKLENRPTLYNYLIAMEKKFQVYSRSDLQIDSAISAGVTNASARRNRQAGTIEQSVRRNFLPSRQATTYPNPVPTTRSPSLAKQSKLQNDTPAGV